MKKAIKKYSMKTASKKYSMKTAIKKYSMKTASKKYQNHASIRMKIKGITSKTNLFSLKARTLGDVHKYVLAN